MNRTSSATTLETENKVVADDECYLANSIDETVLGLHVFSRLIKQNDIAAVQALSLTSKYFNDCSKHGWIWEKAMKEKWGESKFANARANYRRIYLTRERAMNDSQTIDVSERLEILLDAFASVKEDAVDTISSRLLKKAILLALDVMRAIDEVAVELESVTRVVNGTEEIEEMFVERVLAASLLALAITRFRKARALIEDVFCSVVQHSSYLCDDDDLEDDLDADEQFRCLVSRYLCSNARMYKDAKQKISYIPAIPKRYLNKRFTQKCPTDWVFNSLTKNNQCTVAVCSALYIEPFQAINDYERKKEKFKYFSRRPSAGRFPLGGREPNGARFRREVLALQKEQRSNISLMSGSWNGARRTVGGNNDSDDDRTPFKGTLEFTNAGKISGFFIDGIGTTIVRGWIDPDSLSFALDARYTEVGGLPPLNFLRNKEHKLAEHQIATELSSMLTMNDHENENENESSLSSSGSFEELAEQLDDELGAGLYVRYRGVFNPISGAGIFCSNTSASSSFGMFSLFPSE